MSTLEVKKSEEKILINGLPFIVDEIREWHERGLSLKEEILDYNWGYRKKICSKCSLEQQEFRGCFKVNNSKNRIQETHCESMVRAGTQKFRKKIKAFLYSHPLHETS